ncbi:MAG: hypothetical protein C0402_12420 [Thermodesulfovibrio sp.]|nr:hypothetical protein [Thermodesulfovibrio sp.]
MGTRKKSYAVLALLLLVLAAVALTGCGGGGGTTSTTSGGDTPGNSTIMTGTASKGPIVNGTASVYGITNGQKGSLLTTASTGASGSFTANLGTYSGPVMVEVTGGSYTDEATGKTVQMGSMTLRTALDNASGNVTVAVTPLTEAAVQYMNGTFTTNMITLANTTVGTKFGMADIVRTIPHNVSTPAVTGQDSQTYYGFMLAAMSQMASTDNISIPNMITSIASGLKDTSSTGTQTFAALMNTMNQRFSDFETTNPNNKTGVTSMTSMMSGVNTGGGGGMIGGGNTVVSGMASKGPIANGTVAIYAVTNGQKGTLLLSTTTGPAGTFNADLGGYTGPMMVEVTGGSYTDEATGRTAQMGSMMLRAALSNATGNVTVAVTPLTEAAVQYMGGRMTPDMINLANNMMGSKFGVQDIVQTLPQNVMSGAAAGNTGQTYYGLMLAAMSQTSATNNISISTMMSTIADSLKDTSSTGSQTFNNMVSLMGQGFMTFETSNPNNRTGVTTMTPGGMMSTSGGMMGTGGTNGTTGTNGGMMGTASNNMIGL